jgi:hypothetical protein
MTTNRNEDVRFFQKRLPGFFRNYAFETLMTTSNGGTVECWQFSLRTLLVATTLVAVVLGLIVLLR